MAKLKVNSANLDLQIKRGTTLDPIITWKTVTDGVEELVDLTDCTAQMQLRSTQKSDTVLHELTTDEGDFDGITLGDAAGTIEIHISDEDSDDFEFNKAVYSLEITFPNGRTYEKLHGEIEVLGQTTR